MNADQNRAARPAAPMHRSVRTTISENVDATTGHRTQVLATSELTLVMHGPNLEIKYRGSAMKLDPERARADRLARRGFGG